MKHDHNMKHRIILDLVDHHADGCGIPAAMEKYAEHQNAALIARVAELEGALEKSNTELSISKRFADALTKKCMTAMGAAAQGIVDGVMADCLKDRRSIKPHSLLQEHGS